MKSIERDTFNALHRECACPTMPQGSNAPKSKSLKQCCKKSAVLSTPAQNTVVQSYKHICERVLVDASLFD